MGENARVTGDFKAGRTAGGGEYQELVDEISAADLTGIDVPLGWPDAFVAGLTAHHRGEPWPGLDPEQPGDRVPLRLLGAGAGQRLAPPGKPQLAGHRLAHARAQAREFALESDQRVQMWTLLRRREQGAEPAVAILRPSQLRAMRVSLGETQGAANSSAATRRFSPTSTL